MVHHKDPECDQAMVRLIDALCAWERETSRRSMLIFVPYALDEKIVVAEDGKPFPESPRSLEGLRDVFDTALRGRGFAS